MTDVFFSALAKEELKQMSPADRKGVSRAISFLQEDSLREQNKIDLCLNENGCDLWALIVGRIWLGFYIHNNGSVCVTHISLRSLFRP